MSAGGASMTATRLSFGSAAELRLTIVRHERTHWRLLTARLEAVASNFEEFIF